MAPRFLPGRGASDADRQAARASRDLLDYQAMLPVTNARIAASELKDADAARIVQAAPERFDSARERLQAIASDVQASDRALQQRFPSVEKSQVPTGVGASDVAKSISDFDDWAEENQRLLNEALKAGSSTIGSAYVAGIAQMAESSRWQDQARLRSAEMIPNQAALIENASIWRELNARAEAARAESARIEDLRSQIAQTEADLAEARSNRDELKSRVEAMRAELAGVETELSELQNALIELDDKSFELRNEASYTAYADRRRELANRQRDLQIQYELLTLGGAADAEFDGPDLLTAELTGEPTDGLRVLESELELAEARVAALENGQKRMQDAIASAEQYAEAEARDAESLTQLANERKAEIDRIVEQLTQSSQAVMDLENKAIDAARAAVRGFEGAAAAAAKFTSDAANVRREYDSQGKNPRLSMISRDTSLQEIPKTASAYAKMRVGRLLVERATRLTALQNTFAQLLKAIPGATSNVPEATTEAIETARSEALTALNDALQGLAGDTWTAKSGRALAHLLLARIDAADENRSQAMTLLNEALPNPLFPNAASLIALRARLGQPQPGEAPADPDEDFFAP